MPPFEAVLIVTTYLCSLVAGFLFAFAVVVMPGIRRLDDGGFIRAFQAIVRVIQNNQPLFMLMWMGSVLSVIVAAVTAMWALTGIDRVLLIAAAAAYLLCVQAPTFVVNIPLNNQLQKLDVSVMTEAAQHRAREAFEARWNRSNVIRTACASIVSIGWMLLLHRL
jgi:uncharacterized membrane protein